MQQIRQFMEEEMRYTYSEEKIEFSNPLLRFVPLILIAVIYVGSIFLCRVLYCRLFKVDERIR